MIQPVSRKKAEGRVEKKDFEKTMVCQTKARLGEVENRLKMELKNKNHHSLFTHDIFLKP